MHKSWKCLLTNIYYTPYVWVNSSSTFSFEIQQV